MFPITDSIKSTRFPYITIALIAVSIYVFIRQLTSSDMDLFILSYSFIPSDIDFKNPETLYPFISSIFLHGGFFHLLSNMWFLWVFGDNVESRFHHIPYLFVYLISGIAGSLLQYFLNPTSSIPMLGASGAVSGVLGAYYILFPHSHIKTFVFLFFIVTIAEIPAVIYLVYWFILQLFQGFASLPTLDQGGVAFWAHVGGFATGVLLATFLKRDGQENEKGYIEGELV